MNKSKPIKIVLAEDEEIIAMAYKEGLGYVGYDIFIARDGLEALEAVKNEKPDILLLDIIMPNMNGYEVLKAIRKDPKLDKLPIIVLTNLSQSSDEAEARNLGATDYLIKSNVSLKELIVHINKYIN